jgi:arylsulfatase
MKQFDDIVGSLVNKLEELGVADNTIIVVSTDNGAETYTWPDGGTTPFKGAKGDGNEGGFRVPCVVRWPGKIEPNRVINGMMSGMDWFPTFAAAAGNPNIREELLDGKTLSGKEFKVHLDGYDQTDMLTNGAKSARNEFWYFTQTDLTACRLGNYKFVLKTQPNGWFGPTVNLGWPKLYNLRLDPFERMEIDQSMLALEHFYGREFWRFVFMQQEVAKLAKTALDFPPMQGAASFNLDAVKEQIDKASTHAGQ